MNCPRCGTVAAPGQPGCLRCGLAYAPPPAQDFGRTAEPTLSPYEQLTQAGGQPIPPRRFDRPEPPAEPGLSRRAGRLLTLGSCVLAVALFATAAIGLANQPDQGADTPEAAAEEFLEAVADQRLSDAVSLIDPEELEDPEGIADSFDSSVTIRKFGEWPDRDLQQVVRAADQNIADGFDVDDLSALAGVEAMVLLNDLEQVTEGGQTRVYLRSASARVWVDPAGLPQEWQPDLEGADPSRINLDLTEEWTVDGQEFEPFLVMVERDGRWYVAPGATFDTIAGLPGSSDPAVVEADW